MEENNLNARQGDNTLEMAEIGKGYFNVATQKLFLDEVSRKIHETELRELSCADINRLYQNRYAQKFMEGMREGLATGQIKFEGNIEINLTPKKTRWVHVIGIPEYRDKVCVSVQMLFKDVDREARENIDLRLKSSALESSFYNTTEGIAITGIDGSFLQVNHALCTMLGYTEEELKDKKVVDFVMQEDLEELEMILIKFLTGAINRYSGEKQYVDRVGNKIRITLNISIIRSSKGVPLHFVFQLVDITHMHQSKNRIENLLQLVADQNLRLLDFAYIVSHNMRSHTGNLEMLLSLLKVDFPGHTENNYFPMMENAVARLQQTIEDLNNAIVSYSYNEEALQRITLRENINKTIEGFQMRVDAIDATVTCNVPEDLVIQHIETYLHNIFNNLLDNAIKYRDPLRPLQVHINHTEMLDYHLVEVSDNGLGIDLVNNADKVFGMYKTFHNVKDARGIGLFLVKNQMEALKGKIEVASEVNKGSTFKLYFKK